MVIVHRNHFWEVALKDASGREFGVEELRRYVLTIPLYALLIARRSQSIPVDLRPRFGSCTWCWHPHRREPRPLGRGTFSPLAPVSH